MTGMKEGAGEDPFADDSGSGSDASTSADSAAPAHSDSEPQYPYMLTRETVKEDRDNEHVYFLRDEFADREDELHEQVAEILGKRSKDVYLTDVREAIIAAADPEDIAEVLREWGVDAK